MQWHPIFAQLLRPLVQDYYEVQTDVPVGDAPREADLVLLRRISETPPPFHGVWRHLTPWNVLEFKGPTVDPRLRDLDLLIELGLGIDRRLNEERERQGQPPLPRNEVSFWYLANHLGQRFLAEAERLLGTLTALGDGLWRCGVLERAVILISRDVLPVERESIPLHLVSREPIERQLTMAREVVTQPGFWERYAPWLAYLHPAIWEEVQRMARASGTEPSMDLRPLIEMVGLKQVIDQVGLKTIWEEVQRMARASGTEPGVDLRPLIDMVGLKQVIDQVGLKRVVDEVGLKPIWEEVQRMARASGTEPGVDLRPLIETVGLKQVIDQVGLKRVVNEVGAKRLLNEMDLGEIASQLTPEERQELIRRLQGGNPGA
jgi:hypothetical protein